MDFGRPNAKIGWKMASGQLLFLALQYHIQIIGMCNHTQKFIIYHIRTCSNDHTESLYKLGHILVDVNL